MTALERPFAVRIARILDKTATEAAAAVEKGGKRAALSGIIKKQERELLKIFTPQYEQTIKLFGKRILDAFKSHADYESKAEDTFAVETAKWIKATAASQVVNIGETTEKRIRLAMVHAFDLGLGNNAAANEIMSRTGGAIAKRRGITIARTEVHAAANYGAQAAAESTNIPMRRVWIAAHDSRTREDHSATDAASHSKPVGMNEAFSPIGLMYPGDMSGDPADTINCRCSVGYVTDKK